MRAQPLSDQPDVLTLEQAAEVLQVSRDTMRALVADGVIPAFQLSPRTIRIYRDELIEAIERARIQGGHDGDYLDG